MLTITFLNFLEFILTIVPLSTIVTNSQIHSIFSETNSTPYYPSSYNNSTDKGKRCAKSHNKANCPYFKSRTKCKTTHPNPWSNTATCNASKSNFTDGNTTLGYPNNSSCYPIKSNPSYCYSAESYSTNYPCYLT